MTTPTIRPFRDSDLAWIISEHATSYTKILGLTAEEVEDQSQNLQRFLSVQSSTPADGILPPGSDLNATDFPERRVTWVATDASDKPIGCVSSRVNALPDIEDETKVEEWTSKITNLIVRKDHQRRGIGRALLRKVEETLAPDGSVPTICLSVHDEATDARELYASSDYEADGQPMMTKGRLMHYLKKKK